MGQGGSSQHPLPHTLSPISHGCCGRGLPPTQRSPRLRHPRHQGQPLRGSWRWGQWFRGVGAVTSPSFFLLLRLCPAFAFLPPREEKKGSIENGDLEKDKVSAWGQGTGSSVRSHIGMVGGQGGPPGRLLTGWELPPPAGGLSAMSLPCPPLAVSPEERGAVPALSCRDDGHAPGQVPPQQDGCSQQVQGGREPPAGCVGPGGAVPCRIPCRQRA